MLFDFHTQTGLSMIKTVVQKPFMMEKVRREKKKQLKSGVVSNDITVIRDSHNCLVVTVPLNFLEVLSNPVPVGFKTKINKKNII